MASPTTAEWIWSRWLSGELSRGIRGKRKICEELNAFSISGRRFSFLVAWPPEYSAGRNERKGRSSSVLSVSLSRFGIGKTEPILSFGRFESSKVKNWVKPIKEMNEGEATTFHTKYWVWAKGTAIQGHKYPKSPQKYLPIYNLFLFLIKSRVGLDS